MPAISIESHFESLTDPRRKEPTYPLINIVTMAVCAVICGADDFVAMANWAEEKEEWLTKFLDMSEGVPSHDRFNAIFRALKPDEFEQCLLGWITALHEISDGQIVAIDGKTLRRSYDKASSKSAIHMVSAWASENHISLGQVTTNAATATQKASNEITAIPLLLEMIEISGALVTIDAMGCQTAIAEKIIECDADYCLAVKDNQPTLHEELADHFVKLVESDFQNEDGSKASVRRTSTSEKGHSRNEHRAYHICPVPSTMTTASRWKGIKAIGMSTSIVERDGHEQHSVRYYILSKYLSAAKFATAVRGHWSIENSLHWQLDVTFGEDQSRVRKGHADQNQSLLRRTALSLLKNEPTAKVGVKNKRLKAAWSEDYLTKVLFGS